ncbi:hypothetical protein GGH96_001144 [Coemansia sp. RSA 1972]|nr:hypothetical protein GGH96_001144 [Coemansia sp. RSA 1972]
MELQEQLEALGSVLKSQIMSDLNAWEDRRRETQSRNSKKAAKRARPSPLPEIPHTTLVELRRVQLQLFRDPDAGEKIISWAISVLTVFVSVADMKGNCKLSDLIGLPGTKSVFELLVLAVESTFSRTEPNCAESAFVDSVLATSKNPHAVTWILHQYGISHSRQFVRCLHMYAVGQLAHGNASIVGTDPTGLNAAISDLAASHPDQNTRALADILCVYREAVSFSSESIEESDPRRFVLFYLLHTQSVRLDESRDEWLGSAIRFEMQTGFSRFLVQRDDVCEARPLAEAIQVLYGDHGRAKKVSDQALDIARVLGVFEVINIVICDTGSKDVETNDTKIKDVEINDTKTKDVETKDVEMGDADSDRMCLAFIAACAQTLHRLIAREQELIVLSQMPRTVKHLPQPVPPGLQEAVQRGGRTYNNGPISLPTLTPEDAKPLCARLFSLIRASSHTGDQTLQLHALVCDTAPMLVEIMASRMDSVAAAKALVRFVVDDWPVRSTSGPDGRAATSLLRSLAAVGELHRGMLLPRLQNITSVRLRGDMDPEHMQHMVDVLSMAVSRQSQISSGQGLHTSEVVDGLCSVLVTSWRPLWQRCFSVSLDQGDKLGPGRTWVMRTSLVHALRRVLTKHGMRTTDRISLLEHAVCELAKIQHTMAHASFVHRTPDDVVGMLDLARSLLSLVCIPQCASADGIERLAMERLMQLILARPSITEETTAIRSVFSVDCGSCVNMMRSPPNASAEVNVDPRLETMLAGQLMSNRPDPTRADDTLQAEHMLWQNAIRPLAKYPRSGITHTRDRYNAWAFAKPRTLLDSSCPRILCMAILMLSQGSSSTDALTLLLEEYYADALLSISPTHLDLRLDGTDLPVRPEQMELLHDVRRNAGLELVLFETIKSSAHGAQVARHLVSALLVALVVFWNGALAEPAVRRSNDVAFTRRVVTLVNDAYADVQSVDVCPLFEFVTGMELARLLHFCVWRYLVHRMPGAEQKARATVRHVMRQHVVQCAPLFASIYPS